MNIIWWIRNIRPNYCISEFKCNLNSNRLSSQTCNVFRVIIILYTIDLYVVLIPQNDSKWNKIVSIQTMSNQKILCLPPVANTLRDLHMRFTWVKYNRFILAMMDFYLAVKKTLRRKMKLLLSSPEPLAHGKLLWSLDVQWQQLLQRTSPP